MGVSAIERYRDASVALIDDERDAYALDGLSVVGLDFDDQRFARSRADRDALSVSANRGEFRRLRRDGEVESLPHFAGSCNDLKRAWPAS